jgi:D-threonate/D-erythronate kinase
MKLRLLADDLTGALDSAAAFAGPVTVHLDAPPAGSADAASIAHPVCAVATATRDVPVAALPGLLQPSLRWLQQADVAFKKVDSLLRGNTFDEVAWLARHGGCTELIFAPAFPQQGRLTVDGRLQMQRLTAQDGTSAAPTMAEALAARGLPPSLRLHVPDVRSDADLLRLARLAVQQPSSRRLWCGSAGLAQALAQAMGMNALPTLHAAPGRAKGPLLLLSASHHPVSRAQWDLLAASTSRAHALVRHGESVALQAAVQQWQQGLCLSARIDLAPLDQLSSPDAALLLSRQIECLVAPGLPRPGGLLVVGGDTLLAVCRATGAQALRAWPAQRAGWGRAELQGGRWDGLPCHTRSGAFGAEDDLLGALQTLEASGPDSGG